MLDMNLVNVMVNAVRNYDLYTMYIDNYKQEKEAEATNERLEKKFEKAAIGLGISPEDAKNGCWSVKSSYCSSKKYSSAEEAVEAYINNHLNKEDNNMSNETNATLNNNETIKEEKTMTRLQEVLMNGTKTERMVQVLEFCHEVTKKQDDRYVDKTTLAEFLFDNDIIGRRLSKTELKKTKRDTLIETLEEVVNNLTKASVITPVKTESVSVGDLEITKDNTDGNQDALKKTYKLMYLLKANAEHNNKNGYGYTISSFMLQAVILNADTGLEKLKGHVITDEEQETTNRLYKWLKDNEYIKPVVYSVKEAENVRVYTNDYTGRTDSAKTIMVPWNKSAGYTAKKVTSFAINMDKVSKWCK